MENDIFVQFAQQNMNWLMTTVWFGWAFIILADRSDDRLDRVRFAAIFGVVALVDVLMMTDPAGFIFSFLGSTALVRVIIFVFAVAVFINACVQRSRDIGLDRWLALLVLLPGVNIIALLLLFFWPGTPRPPPIERHVPVSIHSVARGPVALRQPPSRP